MNCYIKSKNNYLMEAMIGKEENELFSGLIIHNNKVFYILNNELYNGHHPEEDLVEKDPTFQEILDFYYENRIVDLDKFVKSTLEETNIYISLVFDSELYYSNKNTDNNFKNKIKDLLSEYIPTKESLAKELKSSPSLHITLRKLNYLMNLSEDLRALGEFDSLINQYNFKRK